jgi:hypothetical protein
MQFVEHAAAAFGGHHAGHRHHAQIEGLAKILLRGDGELRKRHRPCQQQHRRTDQCTHHRIALRTGGMPPYPCITRRARGGSHRTRRPGARKLTDSCASLVATAVPQSRTSTVHRSLPEGPAGCNNACAGRTMRTRVVDG